MGNERKFIKFMATKKSIEKLLWQSLAGILVEKVLRIIQLNIQIIYIYETN